MRDIKAVTLLIILILSSAVVSKADESERADPRGAYLAIGATYSIEGYESEKSHIDVGDAIGFSGRIGGLISRYLALEVQTEFTGSFDYKVDLMGSAYSSSKKLFLLTGNLRARTALGRWEPSVLVGLGAALSQGGWSYEGYRPVLRFGTGVVYQFYGYFGVDLTAGGALVPLDRESTIEIYSINLGILYRLGPQKKGSPN